MTTRIAVLSRFYPPAYKGGGPIRTLEALVKEVPEGFAPMVLTSDTDLGDKVPLDVQSNRWVFSGDAEVYYASCGSPRRYVEGFMSLRRRDPSILHLNGFFEPRFSIVPQILARVGFFGRPRIILAPRGEFGAAALSIKPWRKKIFLALYRIARLHSRIIWHASSQAEADDIVRVFPRHLRILIKEDESVLPHLASEPSLSATDVIRFVFLGRLSPIKGLDVLLKALIDYPPNHPPVKLDVVGPAEDDNFFHQCQGLVRLHPHNVQVEFKGAISNDSVRDLLSAYEYLLLPTRGENFGHVIAESLSVSVPVICPDTTPWTPVLEGGGGLVVYENTARRWLAIVTELAASSPDDRLTARRAAKSAYERWMQNRDHESVFLKLDGPSDPEGEADYG